MSAIVLPVPRGFDASRLEGSSPADPPHADLLAMNGWHLDHGRWVCGNHQRTAPCEHQDASGRLRPEYR
jgi:hypothetical protein